jgi:dihydroneopterin aldolase
MDRILLEGLTFFARHGVLPAEREMGQRFTVDVAIEADLAAAGQTDRLADTIDYTEAYRLVRDVVQGEPCRLIETVAERVASRLLALERAQAVTVRVSKRPPMEGEMRWFAVEVTRARSPRC